MNGPTSYRWSGAAYLVGIIMCQLSLAHLSAMAEGRQRLIQDDLAVTNEGANSVSILLGLGNDTDHNQYQ